ncbi:MAG: hypothetical protein ACRC33_15875 [Gemmataceae bacterium]
MSDIIQFTTTVLPGGRIEVSAPGLPEGTTVVVRVEPAKRRLSDILEGYPGGQLFRTADEVDAFLRAERDGWDN